MDAVAPSREVLVAAVRAMRAAAHENLVRTGEILERLERLGDHLDAGSSVTDAVTAEPTPRIVELLSMNMAALETSGADFRTAQARALHDEGMTMDAIGELFGVTRQRISALLR